MVDRVRPLKLETPVGGGTQTDLTPTEVNPRQDGVDSAAMFLQSASTADSACYADRSPADGAMRFTDPVAATRRQADLVSAVRGSYSSHRSLADVIHFLDDGPGDGWASGAVRARTGTGPLPAGYVWFTDATATKRILDVTYSYPAATLVPTSKVWRVYAADGSTVTVTVTDTFTWAGPVLTSTTRTWS